MDYHKSSNSSNTDVLFVAATNDFETTMDTMKNMVKYDNWWIRLCKSISILRLYSGLKIGVLFICNASRYII